ncbi:MAG: hypothetical protein EAZ07_06905 [Cytophagales bacterium]|nr:MAG: hypothetical protein EAZ07_06905 [Cytophagales bacterium]
MFSFLLNFILVFSSFSIEYSITQKDFDRKSYYKYLGSEDVQGIIAQINLLKSDATNKGFVAALKMKKAGLSGGVFEKLSLFREGSTELDSEIEAHPSHTELRLLRLMVQEQAPRILNYNDDIATDAKNIKTNYKLLPSETLKVLLKYCNKSKALKVSDFQLD